MAKNNNLQDLLKSVADAIRSRKGTTDLINAQDFDSEILSIPGGGLGDNTKEVVKAISGVESDNDVTLANAIAKAYDDTPTEQIWSGTRTTANGATIKDGVASVHSIKGRSLVVSQLYDIASIVKGGGIKALIVDGNKFTLVSGVNQYNCDIRQRTSFIGGHRYLIKAIVSSNKEEWNVINFLINEINFRVGLGEVTAVPTMKSAVFRMEDSLDAVFARLTFSASTIADETAIIDAPQLFDLTAMFGAGNEPTSANDFANRLGYATIEDVPYIPYGTSIVSSMPREIVSRGRNLWDESVKQLKKYVLYQTFKENQSVHLVPGTYYLYISKFENMTTWRPEIGFFKNGVINGAYGGIQNGYKTSSEFHILSASTSAHGIVFFVYEECDVMLTFTSGDTTDATIMSGVCVNLSDSLNGTYSPYMPPSTLPITLPSVFADGIKGVGTAFDELTPTKATSVVDVVDLGSLSWVKDTDDNAFRVQFTRSNYQADRHMLCPIYSVDMGTSKNAFLAKDKVITRYYYSVNGLYVRDTAYNDVTTFKNAMSGIPLYFVRATPIETTLDETKAFYQVQNGGTEEIVKDNVAPFVADIAYREPSASELVNGLSNAINE